MSSTSNGQHHHDMVDGGWRRAHHVGWGLVALLALLPGAIFGATVEREPVVLSVAAVNPSAEKNQTALIRIDLPQEVTPKDVIEAGELSLEYDEDRAGYYLYKAQVELAPKETRVFEVVVQDVWFIPEVELTSLRDYTALLLGRLKDTAYFDTAQQLGKTIEERLAEINTTQDDEGLSRKTRIGAYRHHRQTIAQVKEDLARMEKLLTFVGGPPVPEMMEESALKSDAPSRTTTWLVIFLIIMFLGLLGGQFFFTWHRRGQVTQELNVVRRDAFPPLSSELPPPRVKVNGAGHSADLAAPPPPPAS